MSRPISRPGYPETVLITRGALGHPQTQGKIERWQQNLKNRVLLENYFLPGKLEQIITPIPATAKANFARLG